MLPDVMAVCGHSSAISLLPVPALAIAIAYIKDGDVGDPGKHKIGSNQRQPGVCHEEPEREYRRRPDTELDHDESRAVEADVKRHELADVDYSPFHNELAEASNNPELGALKPSLEQGEKSLY
jgi:hypothetical protein